MTVDQVINGLDCCSKLGNLYCSLCPYYGKTFCTSLLKKDAMSVIIQGEDELKRRIDDILRFFDVTEI